MFKKWLLLFALFPVLLLAQVEWNGYLQLRYSADNQQLSSFSVRRAKLWLKGSVPLPHWSYKLQGIFRWQNSGAFILQDAFVEYQHLAFKIRFGQMVPDFSLQRQQSDYLLPVVERAQVINSLIPAAETLARDIGLLLIWNSEKNNWHVSAGLFNGNGANQPQNNDRNFLYTARATKSLTLFSDWQLQSGFSLAFRKSSNLKFKKIFNDETTFSGNDLRWATEFQLTGNGWQFQAEYLQARLKSRQAQGYYVLISKTIERHLLTFSLDQFSDLNPQTSDQPFYIFGYGFHFTGNENKILVDLRTRQDNKEWFVSTFLQLQFFFK